MSKSSFNCGEYAWYVGDGSEGGSPNGPRVVVICHVSKKKGEAKVINPVTRSSNYVYVEDLRHLEPVTISEEKGLPCVVEQLFEEEIFTNGYVSDGHNRFTGWVEIANSIFKETVPAIILANGNELSVRFWSGNSETLGAVCRGMVEYINLNPNYDEILVVKDKDENQIVVGLFKLCN